MSNVELRPHLRSIGCDEAADGLLVGAGDEEALEQERAAVSDGALRACVEQTGMTPAECLADAAAGHAN